VISELLCHPRGELRAAYDMFDPGALPSHGVGRLRRTSSGAGP